MITIDNTRPSNKVLPAAVLQETLNAAINGLKLKKGAIDRYRPHASVRWALLRFDGNARSLVVNEPPARVLDQVAPKFHATQISARADRPFELCVDFWTLKEVAMLLPRERIDLSIECAEEPGAPARDLLLIRAGTTRVRLPVFPVSEFPFTGDISQERAELSGGLLIWHDSREAKQPKNPFPQKRQQQTTNTHTSVLQWAERQQARALAAQKAQDAIDLPALILRAFDRSADVFGKPSATLAADGTLVVRLHPDGDAQRFVPRDDSTAVERRYNDAGAWSPDVWYRSYLVPLTRAQIVELAHRWQREHLQPAPARV